MAEEAKGQHVDIQFDGDRCIHARNCVLGLPDVFRANVEGPWIHPDAAPPDELTALVRRCPSGALTFRRPDGGTEEQAPAKNTLAVQENGPYYVRADATIDGEPVTFRVALCRCGASASKPYCDGSHKEMGFSATGEPSSANEIPRLDERGPLQIDPRTNGPLLLKGPVEITAGSGRTVQRTTRAALCRCGASGNKPFCDGSHARIGFTS